MDNVKNWTTHRLIRAYKGRKDTLPPDVCTEIADRAGFGIDWAGASTPAQYDLILRASVAVLQERLASERAQERSDLKTLSFTVTLNLTKEEREELLVISNRLDSIGGLLTYAVRDMIADNKDLKHWIVNREMRVDRFFHKMAQDDISKDDSNIIEAFGLLQDIEEAEVEALSKDFRDEECEEVVADYLAHLREITDCYGEDFETALQDLKLAYDRAKACGLWPL